MAIQSQMYSGFLLGGPEDLLLENAWGLNDLSVFPQNQEHELMQAIPFLPKDMDDDRHSLSFSQTVLSQIENQKIEIDALIHSQNQRLRSSLLELRKRQTALFVKKYESKIQSLIKQKEEEIARAVNRNMELQNHVKMMEMENQTWQRQAREKQATVESLSSTIQRLRETVPNAAEDADSCCWQEEEERERETWGQETRKMVCRRCNSRNSCVIILPCRHLCSCKSCEAFLDACPVCNVMKKASIEALV